MLGAMSLSNGFALQSRFPTPRMASGLEGEAVPSRRLSVRARVARGRPRQIREDLGPGLLRLGFRFAEDPTAVAFDEHALHLLAGTFHDGFRGRVVALH